MEGADMEESLDIIQKNIRRLRRRLGADGECITAHIAELAKHICEALPADDSDMSFWNENFRRIYKEESELCLSPEENRKALAQNGVAVGESGRLRTALRDYESEPAEESLTLSTTQEKILLCEMIAQRLFETGMLRNRADVWHIAGADTDNDGADSIAYVRNVYSDAAYDIFGRRLRAPTVIYCENFESACEAVYDGSAGYCILPTENTTDGRLAGFSRLISKYELKTRLACEIPSSDGSSYTRLSLMARGISEPHSGKDGAMFSFTFTPSRRYPLRNILCDAEMFGIQMYRIDSMPLSYSQSEYSYHITLKTSGEGIPDGFLIFLTLEAPGSVITGYYPVIRL